MQEMKKAPEGATIQAEHKGSNFSANPLPVAPCASCPKWNECGAFKWCSCLKYGAFLNEYKQTRWERKRRDWECR